MASSSNNPGLPAGERRLLRLWIIVCAAVGAALALSQLIEIPQRSALRGYDNTFNYLWLRSAMVDGDWDFKNDLAACDTLLPEYRASALGLPPTKTGRIPNKYGIGWAVTATPFYLVADGVVAGGRALGVWSLPRDGWNPVYQVCIQLGQIALAILALWLAAQTIAAWLAVDRFIAGVAVVLVWVASPLLYYQTVDVSMSHGAAFFAVASMAWSLVQAGRRPAANWTWLLAGLGWGLAATTRFQLGLFGLMAAWNWFELARSAGGRSALRAAGLFALGALPLVALQVWAWHVVYGQWLVFSYGAEGEGFRWAHPEWLGSLFSSRHGLFYWHPFLLAGAIGLFGWLGRGNRLALVLLATVAATLYVNAAWWCWWFASAFGNRAIDAALLPLMAGVAWLLVTASPVWRKALWSVALATGAWNFYLVFLYRIAAISRNDAVSWGEMLQAATRIGAALHF
jgi:hypothetical protein